MYFYATILAVIIFLNKILWFKYPREFEIDRVHCNFRTVKVKSCWLNHRKLKNSKIMLVQPPPNWKTQKTCCFKHPEVGKLKKHAGSSTVKFKNSKIMLVQAPRSSKTQKPYCFNHRQVEKLKNHARSSTVKLKNSKIMLVQTLWN